MAEQWRKIAADFWTDDWILSLPYEGRYLYAYLITCPQSHQTGLFQLKRALDAFQTGLPDAMVQDLLRRFVNDDKVQIVGDWIFLPKMQAWQDPPGSAYIVINFRKQIAKAPAELRTSYLSIYGQWLTDNSEKARKSDKPLPEEDTEEDIENKRESKSKGVDTLSTPSQQSVDMASDEERSFVEDLHEQYLGMLTGTEKPGLLDLAKKYTAAEIEDAFRTSRDTEKVTGSRLAYAVGILRNRHEKAAKQPPAPSLRVINVIPDIGGYFDAR